jgi:hypothetical protein
VCYVQPCFQYCAMDQAGLLSWRTFFDLRPVNVRSVVDKVILRLILPSALWFPLSVSIHKCSNFFLNPNTTQARKVGKDCEPSN